MKGKAAGKVTKLELSALADDDGSDGNEQPRWTPPSPVVVSSSINDVVVDCNDASGVERLSHGEVYCLTARCFVPR